MVDLPVGNNLSDHLFVDVPFLVDGPVSITPNEIGYEIVGQQVSNTKSLEQVTNFKCIGINNVYIFRILGRDVYLYCCH